ncbi:hypothetical protein DFP72DRAFT_1139128 [Ephemerocybe angulata]|uniref:Uncharacterized protein n=1 Tax=Ephemerocybe angulata TaxID=980116 RepID=A0A8H6HRD1_9AGAR|nr:hypothetical protein DFP72DRAFT_1139128 [Tulosesus angulatus]
MTHVGGQRSRTGEGGIHMGEVHAKRAMLMTGQGGMYKGREEDTRGWETAQANTDVCYAGTGLADSLPSLDSASNLEHRRDQSRGWKCESQGGLSQPRSERRGETRGMALLLLNESGWSVRQIGGGVKSDDSVASYGRLVLVSQCAFCGALVGLGGLTILQIPRGLQLHSWT